MTKLLITLNCLLLLFSLTFCTHHGPSANDNPNTFFRSTGYTSNIFSLPQSMTLNQPWSGSYWPSTDGGIGVRYGAQYLNYNQPADHNAQYQYGRNPAFAQYIRDNYSPAEKYDFLVGDYSYTLTRAVRNRMRRAAKWEGICHGWAPASFMEPTPRHSVTLYASDGVTPVVFYPDDIKALASQFYASSVPFYKTDMMGVNNSANDNNPASFFIAITNLIGLRRTPMIYDSSLGPQIWNYPTFSYEATYYNVLTNTNGYLNSCLTPISQARVSTNYNARIAANNAARNTAYLIGVQMKVNYSNEVLPVRREIPNPNATAGKFYRMILELDSNYNIIGGTWASNDHPDFIWKIDEGYGMRKDKYDTISAFYGSANELRQMTSIAKYLSSRKIIIYAVMKYLVNSGAY